MKLLDSGKWEDYPLAREFLVGCGRRDAGTLRYFLGVSSDKPHGILSDHPQLLEGENNWSVRELVKDYVPLKN